MISRRVVLRPPVAADYETLYFLAAEPSSGWRWGGLPPGPENFQTTLWSGVADQRVIMNRRTNETMGLVVAYGMNLQHGFCYMQMFLAEPFKGRGWPLEAAVIYFDHLFSHFRVRKIYGETSGAKYAQFGSSTELGAELEGRLRDHLYTNGKLQDAIILAITKDSFYENAARILKVLKT